MESNKGISTGNGGETAIKVHPNEELWAALKNMGYWPCLVHPENPKRIVHRKRVTSKAIRSSKGFAIYLGACKDGKYLQRLDLDSHTEQQDARAAYQYLQARVPDILEKCAVKRSTSGSGIDIVFLSPENLGHNRKLFIDGNHVGELLGHGGHVTLPDTWLSGSLDQLDVLTDDELERLFTAIQAPDTGPSEAWGKRAREGLALINGYKDVCVGRYVFADGMPRSFKGTRQVHQIAQSNWLRLQQAQEGERHQVFASFVQSLMFLTTKNYGDTIEEICCVVAAIAISNCPKADEKGYKAEKDTAALIAKILNGDKHRSGHRHFKVPYWAPGYKPEERRPGRPKKRLANQIERFRDILRKNARGNRVETFGKDYLTVKLLAKKLRVSERTVQRYAAQLCSQGELRNVSEHGRRGRLVYVLLPGFGHANGDKNCLHR